MFIYILLTVWRDSMEKSAVTVKNDPKPFMGQLFFNCAISKRNNFNLLYLEMKPFRA